MYMYIPVLRVHTKCIPGIVNDNFLPFTCTVCPGICTCMYMYMYSRRQKKLTHDVDRLLCSWPLVVLGVKKNSSLRIVTVDHRQPQRWNEKLAQALVRSQV